MTEVTGSPKRVREVDKSHEKTQAADQELKLQDAQNNKTAHDFLGDNVTTHRTAREHVVKSVKNTSPIQLGDGADDAQPDFVLHPPKEVARDLLHAMKRPGENQRTKASKKPKIATSAMGLGADSSEG